jgi:molecular chaperone DnaK
MNVSAKDMGTGKEQNITITAASGLEESDIERMVKDADTHSEEDKERRQKVDAHNQLDSLIYTTEKTLGEHKEKLDAGDRGQLETALEDAKKALEGDDLEALEQAIKQLTEASHKLAEQVYQSAAGGDPSQGADQQAGASGQESDDEVIDAEYVDVEEGS